MKYIGFIVALIICMNMSCSKEISKTETAEAKDLSDEITVSDIFEKDIFADIPPTPFELNNEPCEIKEVPFDRMLDSVTQEELQTIFSGIYDAAVIAESKVFVIRYTLYNGSYKIRSASFCTYTALCDKWSSYIGKTPYDVLTEFGTPTEIRRGSPITMLYKKDVWTEGEGLATWYVQFDYTDKTIIKVSLWKQR
ncbi:hypothetical protein HMPREF9194_01904 [Treponema maltophilum ATCC 51939]|uniref:Uncharacterized protein n=1 Tax=Treponema maltophilum ATCC 51939 TaxID=1125699 RepID=S3JZX9_TREMA|nr:hypothetical protein [Treponema maltophilum]EPF31553.1 hypothetical protein HMPREF9194_01904 [Treponema maltophilum ATCC 51939]